MSLRFLLLLSLLTIAQSCKFKKEKVPSPPNIVFLLVDDLGWTDLGCYGSAYHETPNIDQLALQGLRFTNAYASCPVCSPSRASILTGLYPARLNITDWIPGQDPQDRKLIGPQDEHQLALERITIAEIFKQAGYATGFFGKWHLGSKGYYPDNQGFDINKGGHHAGQPASYFYPYKNDRKNWDVPGLEKGKDGEYLTDRLTDEAIQFMEDHQNAPFLLYLSYYTVHTPIQGKPHLVKKFQVKKDSTMLPHSQPFQFERAVRSKLVQDNPAYASMVYSLDESVGRIMEALQSLDLNENTIIVLTSDNGGLSTLPKKRNPPTSVSPLRAGKGWLYEGGIRVPLILRWPEHTKPGTLNHTAVISNDFFPTLLEMAHIPLPTNMPMDGQSLVGIIEASESISNRALYWHFPHYHGSGNRPSAAIRKDSFKLIYWFEDESIELYNLENDLQEKVNLEDSLVSKREELKTLLSNWQSSLKVQLPVRNPNYKESFQ